METSIWPRSCIVERRRSRTSCIATSLQEISYDFPTFTSLNIVFKCRSVLRMTRTAKSVQIRTIILPLLSRIWMDGFILRTIARATWQHSIACEWDIHHDDVHPCRRVIQTRIFKPSSGCSKSGSTTSDGAASSSFGFTIAGALLSSRRSSTELCENKTVRFRKSITYLIIIDEN